jgi:hypothetical protein
MPTPGEDGSEIWAGIDVADVGGDDTMLTIIKDKIVYRQVKLGLTLDKTDKSLPIGDELGKEAMEFLRKYGITKSNSKQVTIEINGVGASMRDYFRKEGWRVNEYQANSKTRSEAYYNFMVAMNEGKIKFYRPMLTEGLRQEMLVTRYEMDNQVPKVLQKKEIKKILGHSPDSLDSVIIASVPCFGLTEVAKLKKRRKIFF